MGGVEKVATWWEGNYYPDAGEVSGWRESRVLRAGEVISYPAKVVARPVAGSARVPTGPGESSPERAVRRARSRIRRYAVANRLNRLVVLTWADQTADLKLARRHVRNFVRWGLRERLGYKGPYVIGWERHKSGNWHANVLVARNIDHARLAAAWGRGYVWIERFRGRKGESGRDAARRAAAYVAKYVAKDLADANLPGQHRYEVAQGFVIRVERVYGLSPTSLLASVGARVLYRFDAPAAESGRGPPIVWAAVAI